MADAAIDSELFVLFDHWPGRIINNAVALVSDGLVATAQHNTTAAVNTPGDKIQIYNNPSVGVGGRAGWSTFVYLKGKAVTEANPTCAAKQVVVPAMSFGTSAGGSPYQVTNDPDQCLQKDGSWLGAIMMSVMTFTHTATKYGWFWCAGVCPESAVTLLTGDFDTITGDVAVGAITFSDLGDSDEMGFHVCAGDTEGIIGWTSTADS